MRTSSSDWAPAPTSATLSQSTTQCIVTFDQQLTPGIRDRFNWWCQADITGPWLVHSANAPLVVAGNTVTFSTTPTGSAPPGNTVYFSPPPFDIIGLNGQPAPAFAGFPLTIIP